jgi:tetratricopeptide (TPR) repeat protein
VEVVGTVLSVDSRQDGVRVAVEVGSVIVRSPSLADGVQRLGAGQSLLLPVPQSAAPVPEALGSLDAVTAPRRVRVPARAPARAPRAVAAALDGGELWTRADAARRRGDPRAASQLLEQLLREHPDDAGAPLAAFTLGTLLVDELGRPEDAAVAFRRALDPGPPVLLREACFLRLAKALREAKDAAGLRSLVTEYAAAHPDGEQLGALRALEREAQPGQGPSATPPEAR